MMVINLWLLQTQYTMYSDPLVWDILAEDKHESTQNCGNNIITRAEDIIYYKSLHGYIHDIDIL